VQSPLLACAQCGLPQFPTGDRCSRCGGALLPRADPRIPSPRDQLIDSYQPFLEVNVGRGRQLLLSQRRLEWSTGSRSNQRAVEIELLECVRLAGRPVWEALLPALACLAALVLVQRWELRLFLGALVLLGVAACLLQKRYALRLSLRNGNRLEIFLGLGTRRAASVQRIESIWSTLSAELHALGVAVAPKFNPGDSAGRL